MADQPAPQPQPRRTLRIVPCAHCGEQVAWDARPEPAYHENCCLRVRIDESLAALAAAQAEVATARNLADWAAGIVEMRGKEIVSLRLELARLTAMEARAQEIANSLAGFQGGSAVGAAAHYILTGTPAEAPPDTEK